MVILNTIRTTSPIEAAEFIKSGGTVAFPTETVYGLGASVFNEGAIAKIFEAKRRPADNPLIAHIGDLRQIEDLASSVPPYARPFIEAFFPGPLTLVLPRSGKVPLIATAGLDSVGIRMPRHKLASEFLIACGVPVVAPSANISGRPSPTTWHSVLEDLDNRIDCILQGEPTEIGLESTVVDCTGEVPMVLRSGAIAVGQLQSLVPELGLFSASGSDVARSPGMKHRHYSPTARVVVVSENKEVYGPGPRSYIGLKQRTGSFDLERICGSVEEYGSALFEFLRESDRMGIETIYCEAVPEEGIGRALMDRLQRAAE